MNINSSNLSEYILLTATAASITNENSLIIIIGGVVGIILLTALVLITILTVAVVCLARKHKKFRESTRDREVKIGKAQRGNVADIETTANLSYIPVLHQISTGDNIVYGEMVNQDSNGLYETIDPPIEDSTTQLTSHTEESEVQEDSVEYDYVMKDHCF